MNAHDVIKASMHMPEMVWRMYVDDLTDDELMQRPGEGLNHLKWQIGHITASEHSLVESACPGAMPALPDGFADRYSKETAASDNAADFDSKEELLRVAGEQRAGTVAVLDSLTEEQLEAPIPDHLKMFGPTVAHIFVMLPTHWMMHAGQWAVLRRKLGRPPLF